MPAIAHQNKILGNTSGGGSTIKVTTSESSLYGQTVTLTDGTTTLTGTFSNAGECEFTGVMMIGTLTATSSTTSKSIQVPYFGVYTMTLSFFTATITVTFDASKGATCTLDGVTASTSPYAFTVSSAGTYTASCILDGVTKQGTAKVITTDGQTETDTIEYGTINLTYANEFRGQTITCAQTGGSTITKTAPSTGNTMSFYPDATGTWEITGAYSGTTYSSGNITVSSLSTAVPATLQTNVTLSVTMYGAAGATISWTDQAGAKTATLDSTGTKTGVAIVIQPSGQTISFTDTNKAKDPDDLSNNYTKNINLTDSTSVVEVMPDRSKVLYWYGYESSDLQDITTANGWSWVGGQVTGSHTHNANDITINSESGTMGGIGSKDAITTSTHHVIAQGITIASGTYATIWKTSAKNVSGQTATNLNQVNSTSLAHYTSSAGLSSQYFVVASYAGASAKVNAMWYE